MTPSPLHFTLVLGFLLATLSGAVGKLNFTSNSGQEIKEAEIVLYLSDAVVLSQSTGELTIPYTDLPEDIWNQLKVPRYALANNPPADLKDLRDATDTKLRAEKAFAGRKVVLEDYMTELKNLKREMIEAGLILEGLKVAEEFRRVEIQLEGDRVDDIKDLGGEAIWVYDFPSYETEVGSSTVTPSLEGWVVERADEPRVSGNLRADRRFTPPFKVVADLRPLEDTQIMFIYSSFIIAAFRDGDRNSLSIDAPTGGGRLFYDKGSLLTDKFQQIEINVWPDRVEVYVDGQPRAEHKGDYSTQSGTVGILPSYGYPFEIKRLGVWPLKK